MGSLNSSTGPTGHGAAAAAPARHAENLPADSSPVPKRPGYGLPCVNCKTYYSADLSACPVCKNPQRVSAREPLGNFSPAEPMPSPEQLEGERERFLRDFHSQVV